MKQLAGTKVKEGGDGTMTPLGKSVRGIDWTSFFNRHPELSPPGYSEVLQAIRVAKLRQGECE